ncbi:MAG TPA: amino acid-binding protein [Actinomycetes bacterium]|nr:amino acid-binding protein [Actinomycetes bacterium]
MKDLMFILPYQAGTLAQLTGALSEAGVNLQGCSGQQFGPEGIIHLLVEDAPGAREAAARAGFVVRGEHEVIVADIEDRPGALAGLLAPLAEAGIDVNLTYLATRSRLVIGVDDVDRARAAMRPRPTDR